MATYGIVQIININYFDIVLQYIHHEQLPYILFFSFHQMIEKMHYMYIQSVTLGTSPMPLTSKNKSGLVKVPVHFNVY